MTTIGGKDELICYPSLLHAPSAQCSGGAAISRQTRLQLAGD
jgi:hypothetical protein